MMQLPYALWQADQAQVSDQIQVQGLTLGAAETALSKA